MRELQGMRELPRLLGGPSPCRTQGMSKLFSPAKSLEDLLLETVRSKARQETSSLQLKIRLCL